MNWYLFSQLIILELILDLIWLLSREKFKQQLISTFNNYQLGQFSISFSKMCLKKH